jgi:hypothetical protein
VFWNLEINALWFEVIKGTCVIEERWSVDSSFGKVY